MISFIIIGHNEGWKLPKCIQSIFDTIEKNDLSNYEVIYVDSKSNDNSIEIAKQFKGIKIFQITGVCNAAIARNIGAKESKGNSLFFIDGDMEIQFDFLPLVYNKNTGLIYEFVSGQWINYNYNSDGKLISKEEYNIKNYSDSYQSITGGLFLIKRHIWFKVSGMKNKMRRSQDLDIALRLSKHKIFLLRKKELLAIHHTIPYNDKVRMWKMLFSGALLFKIVLLRENFFNKYEWRLFLRGNYTLFMLLFSIFISFLFFNPFLMLIYFLTVIIRTLIRKDRSIRLFFTNLAYFPLSEVSFIFAFFFYWPRNHKEEYVLITG